MSREPDLLAIRKGVDRMGRLSDNIVRLGPFSLGLDGVLSWIPGVGEIYSGAAAAYLLTQGVRARVPVSTLLLAAALMGGRTLITAIPLAGPAASDLLTMHKWSAKLIVAAIDRRLGAQAPGASPKPGPRRPLWRSRPPDTASA